MPFKTTVRVWRAAAMAAPAVIAGLAGDAAWAAESEVFGKIENLAKELKTGLMQVVEYGAMALAAVACLVMIIKGRFGLRLLGAAVGALMISLLAEPAVNFVKSAVGG